MKSISNISLFLVHAVLITISLLSHCSSVVRCDENLIEQTCRKTPHPALCISSLKSDPQSSTADLKGLAVIMIYVVKAKAGETSQVIREQLKTKPELKLALINCDHNYDDILIAYIPSSIQAVQLGDPEFGETGMAFAAIEARSCENGFGGKSTITSANQFVHDTSSIASAIAKQLVPYNNKQ
ncbi:hypothetical protein Tsubulata_042340 [Turnera subulata]|uniref:Pectinesterase inhibitor domain-containing protein n=1 Tax=Turnera subulata TaxID=218843 RepID=A0A9Q0JHM8_9ROSI|nr:hypothetical protein Tsubulata_042340 [Turnera subulata]